MDGQRLGRFFGRRRYKGWSAASPEGDESGKLSPHYVARCEIRGWSVRSLDLHARKTEKGI